MKPHVKVFLSSRSVNGIFGQGKYRLLKAVHEEGTLQKAAKRLGRAYRKAWSDLRRAERGLNRKLVVRFRGGADHGRTELTEFGQSLLDAWEAYESDILKAAGQAYTSHLKKIVEK